MKFAGSKRPVVSGSFQPARVQVLARSDDHARRRSVGLGLGPPRAGFPALSLYALEIQQYRVPPTEIMLSGFPAKVALFSAYGGFPHTFLPDMDGGVPEMRANPTEQRPVLLEFPSKPPPSPQPP